MSRTRNFGHIRLTRIFGKHSAYTTYFNILFTVSVIHVFRIVVVNNGSCYLFIRIICNSGAKGIDFSYQYKSRSNFAVRTENFVIIKL